MTRNELLFNLRSLSSGTIGNAIGSDRYAVIDRAIGGAILYASDEATEAEMAPIDNLAGVLSFLADHRGYESRWLR